MRSFQLRPARDPGSESLVRLPVDVEHHKCFRLKRCGSDEPPALGSGGGGHLSQQPVCKRGHTGRPEDEWTVCPPGAMRLTGGR